MPRIRTPWDRDAEVDPSDAGSYSGQKMDSPAQNNIDPVPPAPREPRPEPRVLFEAVIRKDGTVELPSGLVGSAAASVLKRLRGQSDEATGGDLIRDPLGILLSAVRAELHQAVRAALVEQRSEVPEDTTMLTANELAGRLKVHPETVRRWSTKPGFPTTRIGPHAVRFDLAAVLAWRRTGS